MDAHICFDGTLPTYDSSTVVPPEGWNLYTRKTGATGLWRRHAYFATQAEAETYVKDKGWHLVKVN
jgi:hypothetical protein